MLLCLIAGNSFFQSIGFLCFFICGHPSDTVFFRRALAALNCLYAMYLTDSSISGEFAISKEHLQPYIRGATITISEDLLQYIVF